MFAPHWRSDARGVIVGLTQYTRREHICRATLEAVAFQVYEILLAMEKDSGHRLKALLVDGGMTKNDLLMQIQADFNGNFPFYRIALGVKKTLNNFKYLIISGIDVIRPEMAETTSLGAAMAAAISMKLWSPPKENVQSSSSKAFKPQMQTELRDAKFKRWSQAIQRSLGWEN